MKGEAICIRSLSSVRPESNLRVSPTASGPNIVANVTSACPSACPRYISRCRSSAGFVGTASWIFLLISPIVVVKGVSGNVSLFGTSVDGETTWTRTLEGLDSVCGRVASVVSILELGS